MEKFIKMLEVSNLDEALLDKFDDCLTDIIDQLMFQMESKCPEYKKALRERNTMEEKLYAACKDLRETHFRSRYETDYTLMKAVFLLGMKTGIKLAQ